jgi:hypothetical protein
MREDILLLSVSVRIEAGQDPEDAKYKTSPSFIYYTQLSETRYWRPSLGGVIVASSMLSNTIGAYGFFGKT